MEIAEQLEFVEKPRVLAPEEVAGELREYDTRFAVIYGEGLSFTQENLEQLQIETESYGCNCLVINSEYDNIEFFKLALDLVKFITQSNMKYNAK